MNAYWRAAALVPLCIVIGCGGAKEAVEHHEPTLSDRLETIESRLETLKPKDRESFRQLEQELNQSLSKIESQLDPRATEHASQQALFARRVAKARQEIAYLPGGETNLLARDFSARLNRLESAMADGTIHVRPSDDSIGQWLHVQSESSVETPTADVRVGVESRPVILVLSSNEPIHWKLASTEKTHVEAVVLLGMTVDFQCEEDILVFRRNLPVGSLVQATREYVSNFIEHQVGKRPTSILQVFETSEPIEIGPSNRDWVRAHVSGELDKLVGHIRRRINETFAKECDDLRFDSLTAVRDSRSRSRSRARFTLRGPQNESLQPLGGSYWNYVETNNGTAYSLHRHGLYVRKGDTWKQVRLPDSLRGTMTAVSLTYDAKRDRLLLLVRNAKLYAMDCESSKWTPLCRIQDAIAIKWSSEDEIVVIRQSPRDAEETDYRVALAFLNAAGETIRQLDSNCTSRVQNAYESANELTVTDDFLIAVQTFAGVPHHNPRQTMIRVFNLSDARLRYEYAVRSPGTTTQFASQDLLRQGDKTRFAILQQRLRTARASLREAGGGVAAGHTELTRQLEQLSDPLAFATAPQSEPRVHWVRTFSTRPWPDLGITDKSAAVTLAISTFADSSLRVKVAEGVNLRKVILVCDEVVPPLEGLPDDVEIVAHARADAKPEDIARYRQPSYQRNIIEQLAGSEITTERELDIARRHPAAIVVGPTDGDWVVQQVLRGLDEFILSANRQTQTHDLPEGFRFASPYFGQLLTTTLPFTPSYITVCDYRGPILQSCFLLDDNVRPTVVARNGDRSFIACDATAGLVDIVAEDSALNVTTILGGPKYEIQSLMFDVKNARLFCIAGGKLHVRSNNEWTSHDLAAVPTETWCYNDTTDQFHAIIRQGPQLTEVHDIAPSGATLRKRVLPVPIPCQLDPRRRPCTAYCSAEHLIIVLQSADSHESADSKVLVLRLDDLSVVHEGPFEPHPRYESIDEELFERLWNMLGNNNDVAQVDFAIRRLIAGFDDTVSRIRPRVGMQAMTSEELNSHIVRLDADTFAERDAAHQALAGSVLSVQTQLRDALSNRELSSEQRARLRYLIRSADDPRVQRGADVLERIGSYEASR